MNKIQPILRRVRLFLITAFLLLMSNPAFTQALSCSAYAPLSPNGTHSVNGVSVIVVSSGDVTQGPGSSTPVCLGLNITGSTLWLGMSGSFSTKLTFDKPVNNIVIGLTGGGYAGSPTATENFIFTSNGGTVSIASPTQASCAATISGNQIFTSFSTSSAGGGGGLFNISATNNFTTLTISGGGGLGGSTIGFCSASIVPACNAGTAGSNQTITSGTSPSAISLTGNSAGTIQWQSSADNITYTDIPAANAASYSPGVLSATRYYRASVGSPACSSNVVTIKAVPDSDGDGINDESDLDDDNDGILDTVEDACETEGTPAYSNDFGTGTSITTDDNVVGHAFQANGPFDGFYAVTSGPSQAGYPYAQAAGNKDAGNPVIGAGSTNGKYLMVNVAADYGNKVLYRVPNITVTPGTKYRFRLDLAGLSADAGTIPKLQIVIKDGAGNILASEDSGNIGMANDDIWRRASMIFTPTISNVSLEIINLQPINTDGNDVGIDNFVLAPFIACDTDGDGIPNRLDLDSDNDGCSDAIEGGGNLTTLVNSSMPGGNSGATSGTFNQPVIQNLGNTVNTTSGSASYGVPTVAGSGQGAGTSAAANPVANAGTAGANQIITSGTAPSALTVTGSAGTIQWQVSTDNSIYTDVSGANAASYSPGVLTATRYYKTFVTSVGGCTAISNVVTITVSTSCTISASNPDSDGDGIANDCDLDDDNDGILDINESQPIYANYTSATITDGTTNSATVSGIGFGGTSITGTLTRVNNGTTVAAGIQTGTADMSNATVFTPAGTTTQPMLRETLEGFNGNSNYSRYTLTLNNPAQSVTLHPMNVDFMRTKFVGVHVEQLLSGGTEFVYNSGTRELYDTNPSSHSNIGRDGYGSIRITNANGSPITQIVFDRIDEPADTSIGDSFSYTFSIQTDVDTDGDGIPNRLDLDSDNDGCSDAIEGAANLTTLVNSSMPGGNSGATSGTYNQPVIQNLGNTVNTTSGSASYGVPTIAGTGQGAGTSAAANPIVNAGTASANQSITSGTAPAALSLSGSAGTIQWQVSTDNSTYTDVSGANAASYSPGVLTATRYYRTFVTSVGGCTAISNVVKVTVSPDSDGDGINDDLDLDDDNDGILDTDECNSSEKITNATFDNMGNEVTISSVPGWSLSSGNVYSMTNTYLQFFEENVTQTLSQSLTNIKYANTSPTFNIRVQNRDNISPNSTASSILIKYDGVTYATLNSISGANGPGTITASNGASTSTNILNSYNNGSAVGPFTNLVLTLPSTVPANGTLAVVYSSAGSTGNADDIIFDSISLQICGDTDGDGIPNTLDLDSDNDGCPDSREGAGNFNPTNTASGTIASQTPNTNFGTAVNTTTGIPTAVGTGQGVGQSRNFLQNDCLDSDGDTIPNWEDLDDDNDGILDTDEDCFGYRAQNTNGSWLGNTTSNISLTTNTATQTFVTSYSDRQNNYWVNQNGGQQRLFRMNASSHNLTYTFSSGVPASEIAFMIEDVDPSITDGSTNVEFTIFINGQPSTAFAPTILNGPGVPMNYNPNTGKINLVGSANDQLIMLKGFGSTVVNSITLTTTGTGSLDAIAYSVFAYKKCDTDGDGISNHLDLDSDNDGCSDAIEGASTTITNLNLVDSSMPGGNSGATSGSYNQPVIKNLGNTVNTTSGSASYGVPTVAGSGQAIGSSQNTLINGCVCYEDPALVAGATYPVKQGITILGRAGKVSTGAGNTASDWPMVRNSAYTALESKTKGFVITRNSNPESSIAIPVVGMMVFDTDENAGAGCMKIYTGSGAGEGWKCFNTQTCP